MDELAAGNLSVDISDAGREDEVGHMERAVIVFKQQGEQKAQLEQESKLAAQRAEEEKRETLTKLANHFEASIGSIVTSLQNSAHSMEDATDVMNGTAQTARDRANVVSSAGGYGLKQC